ncbi:MAG: DUF433 domain-containing protein [Chloroflexota bacterium]
MTVVTGYHHIVVDENGIPFVAGTTMKVVELVQAYLGHGYSPAELCFQFPHLTMGQIHAALAYYWDNKAKMDADIKRRHDYVQEMKAAAGESPFMQRMRKQGLLP